MAIKGRVAGSALLTGLALPLALYLRGEFRSAIHYRMVDMPDPEAETFLDAIEGISGSMPSLVDVEGFFVEAEAIFAARLAAVRQATRTIHFETFYYTPGRRADAFAEALIDRARAGVRVRMIIDAVGALATPSSYWRRLREAGCEVGFYRKFDPRAPLDFNQRTHRKLLLVDGEVALVGGAGISDDWDGFGDADSRRPWRDFELRYRGRLVAALEAFFLQNWANVDGEIDLGPEVIRPIDTGERHAFITTGSFSIDQANLRLLYLACMNAARRRLWITSPYFMPDPNMREALIRAHDRGVDVRIVTMGPRNDRPNVYHAQREDYGQLLEAGLAIYEYQPSMMHAKSLLLDDAWVSLGSANMDPRSLFQNDELNVTIQDQGLAADIERFILDSIDRAERVDPRAWAARPRWQRLDGQLYKLVHRLI